MKHFAGYPEKPEPLTPENDNERVIGWSPDGNSLILSKEERALYPKSLNQPTFDTSADFVPKVVLQ
jgi:hypothetical protein